jgi:hypothetical protein
MKRPTRKSREPLPTNSGSLRNIEGDDIDNEQLKVVRWPDDPTGALALPFQLRSVFAQNGYRVTRIELPDFDYIWVIKMVRVSAPKIREHKLLVKHIRPFVRNLDVRLKKVDVGVGLTGDRLIVTFIWVPRPLCRFDSRILGEVIKLLPRNRARS